MSTAFDDVRLPEEIEQGAQGGPSFLTSIIEVASGVEQRLANWEQPRASWDVGYGVDSPDAFDAVEAFFLARRGKLRNFRFKDWHDFSVTGQLVGTGNGTTRTFLLVKTYTDGTVTFTRRITRPVVNTLKVYVDGVLQDPSLYVVTIEGGYFRFTPGNAPANTKSVTVDFEFDVPVRFNVDDFKLTLLWVKAGAIPHLPVIEIRDIILHTPTVSLANQRASLNDDASTVTHTKCADILVNADPWELVNGSDVLSLSGADAASFEIVGTPTIDGDGASLYLKSGVTLDGAVKSHYDVTVNVSDSTLGTGVLGHVDYSLTIIQVPHAPTLTLSNYDTTFDAAQSTTPALHIVDVAVHQHGVGLGGAGTNVVSLSGTDAASFHLVGTTSGGEYTCQVFANVGIPNGVPTPPKTYDFNVIVSNSSFPSPPQDTKPVHVGFGVTPVTATDDTPGSHTFTVPDYVHLVLELWGGAAGAPGLNTAGGDGTASTMDSFIAMTAGGGHSPPLTVIQPLSSGLIGGYYGPAFNIAGGEGGTATGGDVNTPGGRGGPGFYLRGIADYQRPSYGSSVQGGKGGDAGGGNVGGAGGLATAPPMPPITPGLTQAVVNKAAGAAGQPGAGGGGPGICAWERVIAIEINTWYLFRWARPAGGAGGYVKKTYNKGDAGAPAVGTVLHYTVGSKGLGGAEGTGSGGDGGTARFKATVT